MSNLTEVREEILYLKKKVRMLEAAVKEAARIFSENPPGDLDLYSPEMINVLLGSAGHPEKWEYYLIGYGVIEVMKEDEEYDESVD